MQAHPPLGPFCQSCGMPMEQPTDFGTEASGYRNNDYCNHCYDKGAFTELDITMPPMIEKCAVIMGEQGILPVDQARTLMQEMAPALKRWRA